VLEVRDTGIGIPEASMSKIFERFYRADNTTGQSIDKIHGAGLGLSIVQETIEAHKGRIEATSEIGKGSTVTIYLPATG
jgi:two-component system phosphate regulon sensor histidine kinase PhoR